MENTNRFVTQEIAVLLAEFDKYASGPDLRRKVLALANMLKSITNIGIVHVEPEFNKSNHERLLIYFKKYVGQVITREELFIVSGGWECTKRTRELRYKFGWPIISRDVIKKMVEVGDLPDHMAQGLKPSSYIMLENRQDQTAAHRYNVIKKVIKKNKNLSSDKKRLLALFRQFVNIPLNGEELADVAGTKEWARRIRELRTEQGWPIMTNKSGRPDLPQGYYVLVEDQQEEIHDRTIPVEEKVKALDRDENRCRKCGWCPSGGSTDPYRHQLELHHIRHHVNKGENVANNLITLCNLHHDQVHNLDKDNAWDMATLIAWLAK